MPKRLLRTTLPLLACISLAGCGGDPSLVRVEGASVTITKPMLAHWMKALASGDFRASVGTKAPAGLVSEPADYKRCEAAVKKITPRNTLGAPQLSDAQILERCRQLYRSVKAQAMSFLISVEWTVLEGAELGLKLSDAELRREFTRNRVSIYPTEAQLSKYLAERRWVVSDLLYELKRSVLATRILPKFQARVAKAGGGEKAYVKLALERYHRLVQRTTCSPGYEAPNCANYHGPESVEPAPNVILEAVAHR